MEKSYKQLVALVPRETPPDRVCFQVMAMIERVQVKRCRLRTGINATLVVGAILVFIPVIHYWNQDVTQSGFVNYLSLIASDSGYIFSHWQDYALSIADSLPVSAGIMILALLVILANSLRRLVQNMGSWGLHRNRMIREFA